MTTRRRLPGIGSGGWCTSAGALLWVLATSPIAAQTTEQAKRGAAPAAMPAPTPAPPPSAAAPTPQPAAAATEPAPPPTAAGPTPPQPAATEPATPEQAARRRIILLQEARALREAREAREAEAARAARSPGDAIPRLTIAASLESLFYRDAGFDVFDDEDDLSTRLGMWAGYDVARLSSRTTLAIELGFGAENHESSIWDGAIRTQLDLLTLTAAATLRFAWLSWLDPQVRVSAGASRLSFELAANDAGTFDDSAISGLGAIGAGLVFHTPPGVFENRFGNFTTLSFGLLVEGGYALRSAVEPELAASTESNAIPLTRASLGELGLSGPYLRSSLLARF